MEPLSKVLIMIICSISKRFCLQWKAFDLLNKMRFIFNGWWRCWRPMTSPTMVAILAAILDLYDELEIMLNPREMAIFVLYRKNKT